ncbi:MAG: hypothetical protein FVQ79_02230 [Planctomycetes bacterium]|nr:hypothetical protein [Planctomycetota bacterium]
MTDENPKNVLILNSNIGVDAIVSEGWPDGKWEIIKGNPLNPKPIYRGKYDVVYANHVLNRARNWKAKQALIRWMKCLRPEGELHMFVPCIEWVIGAYNIDNQPDNLLDHLYGYNEGKKTQDFHSSYDMKLLRSLCDQADIAVRWAKYGIYTVNLSDGKTVEGGQHYLMGVARDENIRTEE